MSLSLFQANQQLNALLANGGKPTVQQLLNLAGNVNVTVPNATTTLLYAGTVNGVPNWQVAGEIADKNPHKTSLELN